MAAAQARGVATDPALPGEVAVDGDCRTTVVVGPAAGARSRVRVAPSRNPTPSRSTAPTASTKFTRNSLRRQNGRAVPGAGGGGTGGPDAASAAPGSGAGGSAGGSGWPAAPGPGAARLRPGSTPHSGSSVVSRLDLSSDLLEDELPPDCTIPLTSPDRTASAVRIQLPVDSLEYPQSTERLDGEGAIHPRSVQRRAAGAGEFQRARRRGAARFTQRPTLKAEGHSSASSQASQ